jgi:nucleotidyltransferase substrate binding protein (TIGR01987 family)
MQRMVCLCDDILHCARNIPLAWESATILTRRACCYDRPMKALVLDPLDDALAQLASGLQKTEAEPDNELLRDGVIQRFEYSHELAIKFIRRALETIYGDEVDSMAYNDLLRTAAERGLIQDVEAWFDYRLARNKTSHTYDAKVAGEVFRSAAPFLKDARFLLDRLEDVAA